jgi:iron complex transport system substrate-binding protein
MRDKLYTRRTFVGLGLTALGTLATAPLLGGCTGFKPSSRYTELKASYEAGSDEVFLFTDSCGREVVLPKRINRISPSGSYAQIMLSSFCPDKLVSLSGRFANSQAQYLDESLVNLPALGRYYGRNADLNYEELIRVNSDVIIDIGEQKDNIANDMDGLQEQVGLPVIFILATLPNMDRAYQMIGKALNMADEAAIFERYVRGVLDFAAEHQSEVAARGLRLLFGSGEFGLDVAPKGSVHSNPIDLLGTENVAVLEGTTSTLVDIEQVMIWKPDVVLLSPAEGYFIDIYKDDIWASVPAVVNKRVYEVPGKPYIWLDKPPSIQTVLGLEWLGNLLYPDIYDFDIIKRAQDFYRLFWRYDLSATEARELMANSTFLEGAGR